MLHAAISVWLGLLLADWMRKVQNVTDGEGEGANVAGATMRSALLHAAISVWLGLLLADWMRKVQNVTDGEGDRCKRGRCNDEECHAPRRHLRLARPPARRLDAQGAKRDRWRR